MNQRNRVCVRRRAAIFSLLFGAASLLAGAREAHAFSGGITTSSFGPFGCNGCHVAGTTPTVMITGPNTVAANSTNEYLFEIFSVGAQLYGGLNASIADGTLSVGGSESAQTQTLPGPTALPEITHGSPKLNSGGIVSFSFLWTAPSPVTTTTLNLWGNAVNFSGSTFGDAAAMTSLTINPAVTDTDSDTVADGVDNCFEDANPGQEDADADGWGDVCDVDPDCTDPTNTDTDSDGIGDACDLCPLDPAPCNCGDEIVDVDEECDLGANNGQLGAACSVDCSTIGACLGGPQAGDPCANDLDCTSGTCCGDGTVTSPEQCDDGNPINDDGCANYCAPPAGGIPLIGCDGLFGAHVGTASVKIAKFKDKDVDNPNEYDQWKTKGTFTLPDGTDIDPDGEDVSIVFNQAAALYDKTLAPGQFEQLGSPAKPKWKFFDDEADVVGAEGWRKAKLKLKDSVIKFGLQGRGVEIAIDKTVLGAPPVRLRQTIRSGDHCATAILVCEEKGDGKVLKCSAP